MKLFSKKKSPLGTKRESDLNIVLATPAINNKYSKEHFLARRSFIEANLDKGCAVHNCVASYAQETKASAFQMAKDSEAILDRADALLVDMTPQKGPSMDVGMAFRTGYMSARASYEPNRVLITGYYEGTVKQDFAQRVIDTQYQGKGVTRHDSGWVVDTQGITIENFGFSENLMIPGAFKKTCGQIFQSCKEAAKNIKSLWKETQALKTKALQPNKPSDLLEVYLAGPDVFKKDPIEVGKMKKKIVADNGCNPHYPMDNDVGEGFKFDQATGYKIATANEDLMNKCQVILVNMTHWHGPMDVGTAFEAGYMSARATYEPNNVLIIGYHEDDQNIKLGADPASETLLVQHAIHKTGGKVYKSFEEAAKNIKQLWTEKQASAKLTMTTDSDEDSDSTEFGIAASTSATAASMV